MNSAQHGAGILSVRVCDISQQGFRLWLGEEELYVPFSHFPWFREATIEQIGRVELPSAHHLYWPELDIDLAVASLRDPAAFPLVARSDG